MSSSLICYYKCCIKLAFLPSTCKFITYTPASSFIHGHWLDKSVIYSKQDNISQGGSGCCIKCQGVNANVLLVMTKLVANRHYAQTHYAGILPPYWYIILSPKWSVELVQKGHADGLRGVPPYHIISYPQDKYCDIRTNRPTLDRIIMTFWSCLYIYYKWLDWLIDYCYWWIINLQYIKLSEIFFIRRLVRPNTKNI